MRIQYRYNHLHAEEYLYYRKENLIIELEQVIYSIDANKYLKISCDKANLGEIYYDQGALNEEINKGLNERGWKEFKIYYYVTENEEISKQIVKISEKEEQKRIIEENNLEPLSSFNQVDFKKDTVAVEVQFGKYFSVAYDLHVKHTFFYLREDIEVGIEIIPTHKMMLCMDTGVAWYENEVTNVIREGRNNPAVPVYILGIESDDAISTSPLDYTDNELRDILSHADMRKLLGKIEICKAEDEEKWNKQIQKLEEKIELQNQKIEDLNSTYVNERDAGRLTQQRERSLINQSDKAIQKRNELMDKLLEKRETPPERLKRILRIEQVI